MPEFFDNISLNIKTHFKVDQTISYSSENLKRCLKLVNMEMNLVSKKLPENLHGYTLLMQLITLIA